MKSFSLINCFKFDSQTFLESNTDVDKCAYTLGVAHTVRVCAAVKVLGAETSLLISIGDNIAIVQDIVDVDINIKRHLSVDVDKLANREIERKGVLNLILSRELFDFRKKLLLAVAKLLPKIRKRFMICG